MTTAHLPAVYRQASRILRRNGWFQHDIVDRRRGMSTGLPEERCPVCLIGAVKLALTGDLYTDWASRAEQIRDLGPIVAALGLSAELDGVGALGRPVMPMQVIGPWNDAPGRTVDEVLDALERAAVAAESGGAA